MGRTNPLALRLRGLVNWPGNVRHQLLSDYVQHIFQHTLTSTPHVRASTTGIWINLTVLDTPTLQTHPRLHNPTIDFRNVRPLDALGRTDRTVDRLAKRHFYYKHLFKDSHTKNPLMALGAEQDPLPALHIYRDTPIHLKVNVISNPLLDAQICAHYIAKNLSNNKPMAKIYKDLLAKMG
ncbi:hypothetical protein PhCBS80983_g00869 [Powellomyces hirtus]|uniref:Uncharacterized protein n=1 Tax=Powellomyces hirtus TaxID=109895 RepID=A0A507EF88_9FUNG|nr:hypothetical protein PhCBS80983_g00869 [Powellomyces hirtus]